MVVPLSYVKNHKTHVFPQVIVSCLKDCDRMMKEYEDDQEVHYQLCNISKCEGRSIKTGIMVFSLTHVKNSITKRM